MKESELKKAFKILLEHSWKIVKERTHKNDLSKIQNRYDKILIDFEFDSISYIDDCIQDIISLYA